ncbi:MAG: hypothetical protein WHT06_05545 [Desulfobacterales bacterium]
MAVIDNDNSSDFELDGFPITDELASLVQSFFVTVSKAVFNCKTLGDVYRFAFALGLMSHSLAARLYGLRKGLDHNGASSFMHMVWNAIDKRTLH